MEDRRRRVFIVMQLVYITIVSILMLFLVFLGRLDAILYDPPISPGGWCTLQPCIDLGTITISRPTSSVFVYATAVVTLYTGIYFYRNQNKQQSRYWWGISLILMGMGALFAGTSYQAFGFEIKCSGNESCVWTSWWELSYNLLTVISACTIFIAVSCSIVEPSYIKYISSIMAVDILIYTAVLFYGGFSSIRFLISFEMLIIFALPIFAAVLVLCIVKVSKQKDPLAKKLLLGCILLLSTIFIYYGYSMAGLTQMLWERGIWFSDNDVLHILMIGWVGYIRLYMEKDVVDFEKISNEA